MWPGAVPVWITPVWITAPLSQPSGNLCSQFVGNGRRPMASSVLVLIPSMFALALTGSPLLLAPEWQDLLLGSSLRIFAEVPALEVLPCSHPAFGEFCQARGGGSLSSSQDQSSLFIFIYSFKNTKHLRFTIIPHRSSPCTTLSTHPKRRCLCCPQNQPLSWKRGRFGLAFIKLDFRCGWFLAA